MVSGPEFKDSSAFKDGDNTFFETAFDAAIDRAWLTFRCELADQLDRMRARDPIKVYSLWTEMFGPQPDVRFTLTGNNRLRLTIEERSLYPYQPEIDARIELLEAQEWRSLRDETCIREFNSRSVDAAAMAAQFAFREVWGIPDPTYLVSEECELLHTFVAPYAALREPKMR
ncbi:TY-Chap domain-containing protein [Gordonia sp. (in: high G+C Gram-positive bacteria)]|uniref:TY-Chap domain-containing protein n=1 Tax=Gordonia sp. (in: high G+C Gram-positive bacteria) TaxID=84139 RepID=UPI003C791F30